MSGPDDGFTSPYDEEVGQRAKQLVLDAKELADIYPVDTECPEGGCVQCDALRFIAVLVTAPEDIRFSFDALQDYMRSWG